MLGKHLSRLNAATLAIMAFALATPALAQEAGGSADPTAPTIRGVLRNSNLVIERLETIMGLTNAEDQKQTDTLQEYVEIFLFGVDRSKPVRMDIFTVDAESTYRLDVPVEPGNFREFWETNLVPLGIPVQQYAKRPELFRLGGSRNDAFTGYMLFQADQRGGYATIAEHASLLPAQSRESREAEVKNLLDLPYDAAMHLQNNPEGVEQRHQRFAADKEKVLAELKRRAEETEADFELRKFAAGLQYDETQRIYAETKNLIIGGALTADPPISKVSFNLEALPETPLAASIEILGQAPSRFAGIAAPENATSTGRLLFPLDDFRKEHFLAMSKRFRENELIHADAIPEATAEQKEATKKFLNALFDRFDAGVEAGVIDAFMDMTKNEEGVYTVVGGVVSPDAKEWVPALELAPQLKNAPTFKAGVSTLSDVAIHEITFQEDQNPEFAGLFGDRRLLIGTGGDIVWYAAGPNADDQLKAAIEASATEGEASPVVMSFQGELLPAFRILDSRQGDRGNPTLRSKAIESFQEGDGQLRAEIVRDGDALNGLLEVDKGVIRLVGAMLAKISRENLAE